MFSTCWVLCKRSSSKWLDGKPDGMSGYFWNEAKKQLAESRQPKPVIRETDYRCNRCGANAYFDGRCGDGPILMCGCGRAEAIPASQYQSNGGW